MKGRIVFDHVWKRFHRGPAHDSLRDLIPAMARRLRGEGKSSPQDLGTDDFWAVRDVSFEVKPGEALGIIGGNGAGKSTTLKLLTKILRPTRGTALVEGRVGSLIEVSAGFHQDLTGRENVFLQGSIMGMPQKLIHERFDDIVEFSGISAFIDTPVKRYSSGMNARLGFAIAVHLEPDVLIIDEVLSVGDAEFQERAFGKIQGLVNSDIPVVIVSHQLDRIAQLCKSCILLRQGEAVFTGHPTDAINEYLRPASARRTDVRTSGPGSELLPTGISVSPDKCRGGEEVVITMVGDDKPLAEYPHLHVCFEVLDSATNNVMFAGSLTELASRPKVGETWERQIRVQANLPAGLYRIDGVIWDEVGHQVPYHGPSAFLQVDRAVLGWGPHPMQPKLALPPG